MKALHALLAGILPAACLLAGTAAAARTPAARTSSYLETPAGQKPRVVVATDPELDDLNSLIRYLLYAPDFRTEGLIYASSQFHWKGDGKGTRLSVPGREYTRFGRNLCPCTSWRWPKGEGHIDEAVDAYAKAYPNLRIHDPGYPTPEALRSRIYWGNVEFDGEMSKDTPGSDLIKSLLLDSERAPVYLLAWGGQSTIARALKSIEDTYSKTPEWRVVRAKVIGKAVIVPSGDQDDTYAKYIKPKWPEIRYLEPKGAIPLGYNAQNRVSREDARYFSPAWIQENISSKGVMGSLYRVWGDGKQMVEGDVFDYFGLAGKSTAELRREGYVVWTPPNAKGAFLGEGDTWTFLNLVDNGLGGYRDDSYGGWGGYGQADPVDYGQMLADLETSLHARPKREETHPFLSAAQRDLAARFHWATTSDYAKANHHPATDRPGPRLIDAKPGDEITLHARISDPDGDRVALRWWRWDAADTYEGRVRLVPLADGGVAVAIPKDTKPYDTIHVIAEATDDGAPALTRYDRIVIRISS